MKRLLLVILPFLLIGAPAWGQGKVQLANNSATLIVLPFQDWQFLPPDAGLVGQWVPTTGPLPSGITFVCGLYAGTSSAALSLYTTVLVNPLGGTGQAPGVISPTKATLPWGAVLTYMQVKVWNSVYATYEAQPAWSSYRGETALFTMTPSTSIAYPNTCNGGGTTYPQVPLYLVGIPEPSIVAFGTLTLGLLFCRSSLRREKP